MLCDPRDLPVLLEERCTLCGLCEASCPQHGIRMSDKGPIFTDREHCDACGNCEDACPEGAIVTSFEITESDATPPAGGKNAD
ncbi:MAG: 4Fe-4S binding protein [Chloroflexi bacterium]|nr:4Fe-4S binding protein [Chloroflexota bacterium]